LLKRRRWDSTPGGGFILTAASHLTIGERSAAFTPLQLVIAK
jgi:hypothetical protein